MNQKSLLIRIFLLAGLAVTLYIIATTDVVRKKYSTDTAIDAKGEKEGSRKEGKKSDRPDAYAEFQKQIRTPVGSDKSSYELNYKMIELKKAGIIDYPLLSKSSKRLSKAGALNWVERGPANVGGRTRGLIVDPADVTNSTWWAGSVGGGIWKTTNKGTSWVNKTPDIPNLATTVLTMAASNSDIIYAGTGEGFFNGDAIDGDGILKSTDHGETWTQLVSTAGVANFQNINRIIVSPSDPNIVLASTNNGIYKSTNGGTSWTTVYGPAGRVQHIIADPADFDKQWATINATGVIRSTNAGDSWTSSSGITGAGRMEIAIAPTDPTRLYISAEVGDSSFLYVSDDAGVNWEKVLPKNYQHWLGSSAGTQGWYDNTIAVHPYGKDTVFVGGVNISKCIMLTGSSQSVGLLGIDTIGTGGFLAFTNFGLSYMGGGVEIGINEGFGTATASNLNVNEFVSVQLRFGPGKTQKAHQDTTESQGAGQIASQYHFKNYVDIPFEVWDITNTQQLMVSFRDENRNGQFDLSPSPADGTYREYLFIHAVPYSSTTPNAFISGLSGCKYKTIYEIGPSLPDGATWNPGSLPTATMTFNWGSIVLRNDSLVSVSDPYGAYGGANDNVHPDHHNLVIIPIDQGTNSFAILNANDGGLAYSSNGGKTWGIDQNSIFGYNTTQFYGVDKKPGGDQYMGGTQDNGSWLSPINPTFTSNWSFKIGGDGFDAAWHYTNSNLVLGSLYDNRIYKSSNGGASFVQSTTGLLDVNGTNSPFITQIGRSKMEPDIVFTTGGSGVWRSTNFGSSWALSSGISTAKWGWIPNGATFVEISVINPQVVWAGKTMSSTAKVFVSIDGGVTFTETASYPTASWRLSGMATHATDDNTAYALFSVSKQPKILRTTNRGQSWQDITGFNGSSTTSTNGFPDVATYCLLVMPHNPNEIWAGTEIGLFISTDNGATWNYANNGLPALAIWEMWIVDQQVVLASHGRGIWSVDIPAIPFPLTITPVLNGLQQNGNTVPISLTYRSLYDSTVVRVDSAAYQTLAANGATGNDVVNYTVTQTKKITIEVWSYKNGVIYKSNIRSLNVALADVTPPVLTLGALASPVVNVVRFAVSGNENLSTASLAVNSSSVTLTKQSNIFFGTYALSSAGSLNVVANGSDLNSNAGTAINRTYNVSPLSKATTFANYKVSGSGDGYLLMNLAPAETTPPNWMMIGESVEMLVTGSNNGVNVEANYTGALEALKSRYADFEDAKIGLYEYADGSWKHTGGEGVNGKVAALFKGSRVAVFYNPDYVYVPKEFTLSQNYPNPFNPSTTIRYEVPSEGRVVLKVYNLLGQEVRTLANTTQGRGVYHVQWDGKDQMGRSVASGVYLYRLEAGNIVKSKKMLFIK
ncbi:T9SS type A sorting domain-containing protein [bacterium]|nr:MAG: T9SS type A sorting domain-containing protein [bacterium]